MDDSDYPRVRAGERRRAIRFVPVGARVRAREIGSRCLFPGEVIDLSDLGARFTSAHAPKEGDLIEISITVRGSQELLECTGEVRWTEESDERPGEYVVGVAFDPLADSQIQLLQRLSRPAR